LVAEATGGTDPNLVIAALLHDAIEDQGVTSEMLAYEFGAHVADIVIEVSDDKALPNEERKRRQVEKRQRRVRGPNSLSLPTRPATYGPSPLALPPTGRSSDDWNISNGRRPS
jgi:hypothetical protein